MSEMPTPPIEPGEEQGDAAAKPSGLAGLNLLNRHLRYPNAYLWLLLLSALDVMLTWTIFHFGGSEANPVAEAVIDQWGLEGMIIYKFSLITLFILICEGVGSLRETTGRMLSRLSIAIAAVPVVWSLILLTHYTR